MWLISRRYPCSLLPTFVIFKNKTPVSTIQGANPRQLLDAVQTLAGELGEGKGKGGESGEESGSGGSGWLGLDLSRGYGDVTEHVDPRGLDILNSNSECGKPAVLFEVSQPSALDGEKGKGKSKGDAEEESDKEKDWVESDTDDQLMLYIPFKAALKVQSLHITSLPPKPLGDEDEDIPMRPKTIRIYSNRAHVLGFEEAEDIPATQGIMLRPQDWDEKTGTVRIDLRFVKFQNVTSLVIFVMDGDGQGEKVRLDRLRIIGEAGEKRELGKLEKIGDLPGE